MRVLRYDRWNFKQNNNLGLEHPSGCLHTHDGIGDVINKGKRNQERATELTRDLHAAKV